MRHLIDDIDVPFRFTERPTPLAGDLRPAWRVGLILLMLLNSRGQRATLQKLHLLNSACRSEETRRCFLRYAQGDGRKDDIIPRVEPSLIRAINLARGEGLIEVEKGKNLKLTPRGVNTAKQLGDAQDCMVVEKEFLRAVGKFTTESNVESLFTWNLL
jgi:hypothetical protein